MQVFKQDCRRCWEIHFLAFICRYRPELTAFCLAEHGAVAADRYECLEDYFSSLQYHIADADSLFLVEVYLNEPSALLLCLLED